MTICRVFFMPTATAHSPASPPWPLPPNMGHYQSLNTVLHTSMTLSGIGQPSSTLPTGAVFESWTCFCMRGASRVVWHFLLRPRAGIGHACVICTLGGFLYGIDRKPYPV
jgi:hypothetical protein